MGNYKAMPKRIDGGRQAAVFDEVVKQTAEKVLSNPKKYADKKIDFTEAKSIPIDVGKIMREKGYSLETSKTPATLTGRKKWKELLQQRFPDEVVLNKTDQLLNARNPGTMIFDGDLSDEQIKMIIESERGYKFIGVGRSLFKATAFFLQPDNLTQKAILGMVLDGSGRQEEKQGQKTVNITKVEIENVLVQLRNKC